MSGVAPILCLHLEAIKRNKCGISRTNNMAVLDFSQRHKPLFCLTVLQLGLTGGGLVPDVCPVPLSENIYGKGVCVLKYPSSALLMCLP